MVGFIQALVGKNNYLVQFKDRQEREVVDYLMLYIC